MTDLNENLTTTVEQEEQQQVDYSLLSVEELLTELKRLGNEPINELASNLKELKSCFDQLVSEQKSEALNAFLEDGGTKDDFEYRVTPELKSFYDLFDKQSKNVKEYYNDLGDQKRSNTRKREEMLVELRDIVDGEESKQSFERVKEIQSAWKEIKIVARETQDEMWSNYKALMDRYYANRSIFFELKTLDRKKNQSIKEVLCEKAEALLEAKNLNNAFNELNQLHDEYKTVGPVPDDVNETIWQRFKTATEKFHDKRRVFLEGFKEQLEDNLRAKIGIIENLIGYSEKSSNSIEDWKTWTEEVLKIQEEWKSAGQVPRDKVKDVNRIFWDRAKLFFENKRVFFKGLDDVRKVNLEKKVALCEKVEAFVEQEFTDNLAQQVINSQKDWKKVGPVPKSQNEKIYARFKAACDAFFDKRRAAQDEKDKEFEKNAEVKLALIEEIKGLKEDDVDGFKAIAEKFDSAGFVPRNKVGQVQEAYKAAADSFIEKSPLDKEEQIKLALEIEMGSLKDHPNAEKIIYTKRTRIQGAVNELKEEIGTLNNNIEFFARSKNADQIRKDTQDKIDALDAKISKLKEQLKVLRSFS